MRELFDIRSLAKSINRRRAELERAERRVPVTPVMSRILENDDEYIPYRARKPVTARPYAAKNPAIGSVVEIAASLDTTVGGFLGERAYRITNEDRRRVLEFVRFLVKLFELDRLT